MQIVWNQQLVWKVEQTWKKLELASIHKNIQRAKSEMTSVVAGGVAGCGVAGRGVTSGRWTNNKIKLYTKLLRGRRTVGPPTLHVDNTFNFEIIILLIVSGSVWMEQWIIK